MQFYSSMAVLKGSGVVCEKKEIKLGPKRGDYVVDLKVEGG